MAVLAILSLLSALATGEVSALPTGYLKASNTDALDHLGGAVAASGDTIVVGAPLEDSASAGVGGDQADDSLEGAGAAYVFTWNGSSWMQQAYLKASNPDGFDSFGGSVAIDGDTIVVGAWQEDGGANGDEADDSVANSGAAYVFVRTGSTWTQQAYLKASTPDLGDGFGFSVGVAGDTVVVGAPFEDSSATGIDGDQTSRGRPESGAIYVFERSGTAWTQAAYGKASNTDSGDNFGVAVAVGSDDLVIAGAIFEDSPATGVNGDGSLDSAQSAGAAYVFARSGSTWAQEAYLKASNAEAGDGFGSSVAAAGETVIVGAATEDSSATGVNGDQTSNGTGAAGAAYVFVRSAGVWSQQAYLKTSNPDVTDRFGEAVAVCGDVAVVGAAREDGAASGVDGDGSSNAAPESGAAYLFHRSAAAWSPGAYLKASNTDAADSFGTSVATGGGHVVVGALLEDSAALGVDGDGEDDGASAAGAAYAFALGLAPAVAFRNAGTNPTSYAAGPIEIGGAFTATVDNNVAGQLGSLLFAFEAQVAVPLANGATLLCLDLGSGELFTGANLAPSSSAGGMDSYDVAVPDDPTLLGLAFSSQAIQFGSPPFVLSNAQDFTIGGF